MCFPSGLRGPLAEQINPHSTAEKQSPVAALLAISLTTLDKVGDLWEPFCITQPPGQRPYHVLVRFWGS